MNKLSSRLLAAGVAAACLVAACRRDMSLKLNEPRNIKGVLSYQRAFPDMNDVQLEAARARGISPIGSADDVKLLGKRLRPIATGSLYRVDSLTHSIPYLLDESVSLLDEIGSNFQDSLAAKGLNPYKVIVTSALRTEQHVKKLVKRNRNAVKNSAHSYGTTFDISWKRFEQVPDRRGRPLQPVREDTLKMVLSEVLRDLRQADRCYVKHELKQGCFHITSRGR